MTENLEKLLISEIKRIDEKIEERSRQVDIKFNGSDKALRLAAEQLKHQLSEMNNVKATFVSRTEIESALEKIELRIEPLLKSSQIRTGADRWKDYILIVIISLFVSGIVSGLVTILWRKILT